MTEFFQDPPRLGNQYDDDRVLRAWLRQALAPDVFAEVEPGLRALGARAAGEMLALADAAEAQPPRHVPYDAWGRRIDRIETSDAWAALDRIATEEGIVATAYERRHGALSRLHQLARLHLFHPSSAIYSCPLAMTDGAARTIEHYGGDDATLRHAFERLTSRDPARAWTSGQWMTERTGGSDVSGTSTVARPSDDGFRLTGSKWFTSATTAQVALTLARIEGDRTPRSAGLSLFYVELRDDAGALRGIRVDRLKDKLGTRALPTAELTLDDTPARLVGEAGHGVRKIATLLNVTRLYNAVCAVAGMRRAIALAADYATRRVAFGRPLAAQPLHAETLAAMTVEYAGCFHLTARVAELLGREDCGTAGEEDRLLLRLLTPVAKLYTGKQAVAVTSEAIEAFGGAGYIEDSGLPRLLREAHVLPIWEGTTNVLSLDVLRVLAHESTRGALAVWRDDVARRTRPLAATPLAPETERLNAAAERILLRVAGVADPADAEAGARDLGFAIALVEAGALLLAHAGWCAAHEPDGGAWAGEIARRWCARDLARFEARGRAHLSASAALVWPERGDRAGPAPSLAEPSRSSAPAPIPTSDPVSASRR